MNLQWDSESDEFGANARLRWTWEPGNDFFVVLNRGYDTTTAPWSNTSTNFSTKAGVTLRF